MRQEVVPPGAGERQQLAAWLLTVLQQRFPDRSWPVVRTARCWLKAAGLNPAPRGRRPSSNAPRAKQPHEVGLDVRGGSVAAAG